jgi:hypothetical protein
MLSMKNSLNDLRAIAAYNMKFILLFVVFGALNYGMCGLCYYPQIQDMQN